MLWLSPPEMKIQATLTADDYVQAQFLHMRPRPIIRLCGIGLVIAALTMCVWGIVWPTSKGMGLGRNAPALIGGFLAYLFLWYRVLIPSRARKVYAQQKSMQLPYEATIDLEAYQVTSETGQANVKWTDFHKYKVGKNLILVYQSDVLFYMFPKRWFTEDQFREFQGILQVNLGEAKV